MAKTSILQTLWNKEFNQLLKTQLNANVLVSNDLLMTEKPKVGKTEKIQRMAGLTSTAYNSAGGSFETIATTEIDVVYDQDQIVDWEIESTDEFFSNNSLSTEAQKEAAYAVSSTVDKWVYNTYPTLCGITIDDAGSYLVVNATNIQTFLGSVNTAFNLANIPFNKRTIVVPYWMDTLIRDLQIGNLDSAGMGQGFVTKVYDFKVYMSNNIKETTGDFDMVGGYDGAFQGAVAYSKLWTGSLGTNKQDSDGAFIHYVFGGNAVKPEAMILMKVKQA